MDSDLMDTDWRMKGDSHLPSPHADSGLLSDVVSICLFVSKALYNPL